LLIGSKQLEEQETISSSEKMQESSISFGGTSGKKEISAYSKIKKHHSFRFQSSSKLLPKITVAPSLMTKARNRLSCLPAVCVWLPRVELCFPIAFASLVPVWPVPAEAAS
jgi:hypothetical protein